MWVPRYFPEGWRTPRTSSQAPALSAPSSALVPDGDRQEGVYGAKQGSADTRQPARRLLADPCLKIIQSSGCENLNKQGSG